MTSIEITASKPDAAVVALLVVVVVAVDTDAGFGTIDDVLDIVAGTAVARFVVLVLVDVVLVVVVVVRRRVVVVVVFVVVEVVVVVVVVLVVVVVMMGGVAPSPLHFGKLHFGSNFCECDADVPANLQVHSDRLFSVSSARGFTRCSAGSPPLVDFG